MKLLYNFLYNLNGGVTIIITVVSAMAAVISIIQFIFSSRNKKIASSFTLLASVLLLILMIVGYSLVKVPKVVGSLYVDARAELRDVGLRYNVLEDKDQSIVKSQSIKGGTIVKKNTKIELVLKDNPDVLEKEKEEHKKEVLDELRKKNTKFVDVSLVLLELKAQLVDEHNAPYMPVGVEIPSPVIKNIKLTNTEYNLEFTDYRLISGNDPVYDNSYVLKDIPVGEYNLEIEVDGYEHFSGSILVSNENLQYTTTDLYSSTINLYKIDAAALYSFTVHFVDSAYQNKMISSYSITYDNVLSYGSPYEEESFYVRARLGDTLLLSVDNITKKIELNLREPGDIFVMIADDGTVRQIEYVEWLNGISK